MKKITLCLILIALFASACTRAEAIPTQPATAPILPTLTLALSQANPPQSSPVAMDRPAVPYDLISLDSLLSYLADLTSIQPYSGWRSAASSGEVEAHAYVADKLDDFSFLKSLGMEIERQSFPVFLSVEFWESRLFLALDGREVEVPVSALRGSRYDTNLALNFDSDGSPNDAERNPVAAGGPVVIVRQADQLDELAAGEATGKIIILDYSLIDYFITLDVTPITHQLEAVIAKKPAGIILLTQYSNQLGESHGTVVGDGGVFQRFNYSPALPILHARLEDLAPAGITSWDDLDRIENARLTWDADVFSPGKSGNLVARIPGADSSRAVILGAHIDSPNSPGAFDNGSGSATLLEVARVLDLAQIQPPVDLYLAWFGSHELGIYGSANFVAANQELLDRTIAMLQMDCLGYPVEGSQPQILAETWSYGQYGDESLPWPDFLAQKVQNQEVALQTESSFNLLSDNSNFNAFDVPNLNLEYFDYRMLEQGPYDVHYLNHLHDPYETVQLASQVGPALEGMAKVALAAALETGVDQPDLRQPAAPQRRALFVASHTEPANVAPTTLLELGMALAWEGFDVDLLPYGQPLTAADLENVGIVVLLPGLDYLGTTQVDWSEEEIRLLDEYVAQGGFLILTNSQNNLAMNRVLSEVNEDSLAINDLSERMGIRFKYGVSNAALVKTDSEHPLMADASYLKMFANNGVPFELASGQVLAAAETKPIIALVDYGDAGGQVLVIGDIGLLVDYGQDAKNLNFVQNIARYAAQR